MFSPGRGWDVQRLKRHASFGGLSAARVEALIDARRPARVPARLRAGSPGSNLRGGARRKSKRAPKPREEATRVRSAPGGPRGDVWLEARAPFVEGDAGGHLVGEPLPAFGRASEGLGGAAREGLGFGSPDSSFDLRVRVLEADDVEGVFLAA